MDISKFVAHQVQQQFPAIYLEEGTELVEFVKSYYEFLEKDITGFYVTGYTIDQNSEKSYFSNRYTTLRGAENALAVLAEDTAYKDLVIVESKPQSVYHNRRLFEYGDIDQTLEKMLQFYKKKYLSGLPFNQNNIRFAVKHILDLYRKKGSKSGLEIFFRMFYRATAEVYYPSNDILKPSASKWRSGRYVELLPVDDPSTLSILRDNLIIGSVSKATAIVDKVLFYIISNTLVPVIYITDIKGQFKIGDSIVYGENSYGRIRGSLSDIRISQEDIYNFGTPNNEIGDTLSFFTVPGEATSGFGGSGIVKKISTDTSGSINFAVLDGGFGYTTSNTDIYISDQSLFIDNNKREYIPLETVYQSGTNAFGLVIGQDTSSIGVKVLTANSFITGTNIVTVDRVANISKPLLLAAERNMSANFEVGELENTETIIMFTDLISDFLDVPLDSTNFSLDPNALTLMTGNSPTGLPAITLNTPIQKEGAVFGAFEEQTLDIGSIKLLANVQPGSDYFNNVFVLARDNITYRYGLYDQTITYDGATNISLSVGDIIVQNNPTIDNINLDIRGVILRKNGDVLTVRQRSFASFSRLRPIYLEGNLTPIDLKNVQRNYNGGLLGFNANILGNASFTPGRITEVDVLDSGIAFIANSAIYMVNTSKINAAQSAYDIALANPATTPETLQTLADNLEYYQNLTAGKGTVEIQAVGETEGRWLTATSQLNSRKVIQDSDFYQDFSYMISTNLSPSSYEDEFNELMHVSGTKAFFRFSAEEVIDNEVTVTDSIEF